MSNKIQILNRISVTVDGSTVIQKDDILSVTKSNIGQEPIEGKTFGGAFHAIPISGVKTFSITVKAESKGHEILSRLFNEYTTSPKYHKFMIYDGTSTTTTYLDALVFDVNSDLNVDSVVSYEHQISALNVRVDVAGGEDVA